MQLHIKGNLHICCSANGTGSIRSHSRGKSRSISAPSGQGLSFLSNCCCACRPIGRRAPLQKLGQQTTPGLLQETKQNEVMEKRGLSVGLQSFLAWHNIRFVMTVNSVLTLTESLTRINCVHEFLLCVCLTLWNLSNSTYYGVIVLFHYTQVVVCMPGLVRKCSASLNY